MTKILAFAGKKQSGKNSCCSFLHGYQMKSYNLVDSFDLTTDGHLVIDSVSVGAEGSDRCYENRS